MKISLKLTKQELMVTTAFLELSFNEQLQKGDIYERMIFCNLSEMLVKFKMTSVIIKPKYNLKISAAAGLAFIAHCRENIINTELAEPDTAILNKIISVIDQKTC